MARRESSVAPDGRRASWVDDATGTLRIVDLGTGKVTLTRKNVDAQCAEPGWAPDSRHLLLHDVAGTRSLGVLDVATGTVARLPYQLDGCHLTWVMAMKPNGVAGRLGMTLGRPVMARTFQKFLHNLRDYSAKRYATA